MWNPHSNPPAGNQSRGSESVESKLEMNDSAQRTRLNQIFNTALVASHSESRPDSAAEIRKLMEQPAFGAILNATQLLAGEQGVSEIEAARELISTFRKLDRLWGEFLVSEGADRLKLSN